MSQSSPFPFIATAEEVLTFNRLFKLIRSRRKIETSAIQATWINIAFSFEALKLLSSDADKFTDEVFKQGMAARGVEVLVIVVAIVASGLLVTPSILMMIALRRRATILLQTLGSTPADFL